MSLVFAKGKSQPLKALATVSYEYLIIYLWSIFVMTRLECKQLHV